MAENSETAQVGRLGVPLVSDSQPLKNVLVFGCSSLLNDFFTLAPAQKTMSRVS